MKYLVVLLILSTGCGSWELNPYTDLSNVRQCDGEVDSRYKTRDYGCANAVGEAEFPEDYTDYSDE